MADILACRVCLSTNVKLYDMYAYQLNIAYENLTGIVMAPLDGFPQYTCVFCTSLLQKCWFFKKACYKAQDVLKFAQMQNCLITTEYINSLKLPSFLNFGVTKNNIDVELIHNVCDIKDEVNSSELEVRLNFSSDEEPLSRKVKTKHDNAEESVKLENAVNDDIQRDYEDNGNYDEPSWESDSHDNLETDGEEIDVIVLSKEQQIEEVQSRKNSLNYLNSFYKCEQCFKGFITDATYKNHMVRHDPSNGAYSCDICRTRWPHARSLRAHVATSHERKFVCRLCNHVSKSRHRAKEHSKWHNGHLFICKVCGASFSKSTSHLTHVRLHHPSKHACEVCGESFIGENGLNMHKKKAHRGIEISTSKKDTQCPQCNAQFQTTAALKRHLEDIRNDICDPNLRPCLQCGEGFSSEQLLKDHLKSHSKDEPVKCDECGGTFAHERSFAVHYQRAHRGVRARGPHAHAHAHAHALPHPRPRAAAVVCEICGKKCISKATLLYHQRTHTGEKPYQCTECPKRFSVYQRLQIHIRTHTGERPYKCSHCPKAFKHKAALNRHDRVHSGAKPYGCSHCGKCFSQSNSMKLHVRTVHLRLPAPYRAPRDKADVSVQ